jgi:hypothetical protein
MSASPIRFESHDDGELPGHNFIRCVLPVRQQGLYTAAPGKPSSPDFDWEDLVAADVMHEVHGKCWPYVLRLHK